MFEVRTLRGRILLQIAVTDTFNEPVFFNGVLHQRNNSDGLRMRGHTARLNAREIQKIINHLL